MTKQATITLPAPKKEQADIKKNNSKPMTLSDMSIDKAAMIAYLQS